VPFLIDNIFWRRQSLHQTIAAVLYAFIKIFGGDPDEEKGCLNTGAHVWLCYFIGIYVVLTAINAILDVWKTSCRTRSKEHTPLIPLSKNQDEEEVQALKMVAIFVVVVILQRLN
jgi:hypothetical protein